MCKAIEQGLKKIWWYMRVRDNPYRQRVPNPEEVDELCQAAFRYGTGYELLGPSTWETMRSLNREGVGRWIDRARARHHPGTSTLQ